MPYQVSLHKEEKMTHNVKYRTQFAAPAIWSGTVVNNGNFANKNLFVDNSVELVVGNTPLQWGNEKLACECNYIKITWDKWTVIGLITDWQYINDGNMNISYSVDSFMSALVSGEITDMKGVCERVNYIPSSRESNDQSEPFSCSDIMKNNNATSAAVCAAINGFEGTSVKYPGVFQPDHYYVLCVSPAIVDYCNLTAMDLNPTVPSIGLKDYGQKLNFKGSDTTISHGGMFRGTPVCFDDPDELKKFCKDILSGCGFITVLPGNGYSIQQANNRLQYQTQSTIGGGQTTWQYKNEQGYPMESIRFIADDDIYSCYCIPQKFCTTAFNPETEVFEISDGMFSVGSFGEDAMKVKFTNYPYHYMKLRTIAGDTVDIIPQTNLRGRSNPDVTFFHLWLRYCGGDSPCLQGMIGSSNSGAGINYMAGHNNDWFTIRNYPAITLNSDMSVNAQVQKDIGNMRQYQATKASALVGNRVSSPMGTAYHDAVNGRGWQTENLGLGSGISSGVGNLLGKIPGLNNGSLFKDKTNVEAQQAAIKNNANATVEGGGLGIMGNNFAMQLAGVPATVYNCGATMRELKAFSRYIEEFGQSFGDIINPLDNSGTIFEGTIVPIDDRTFYQFSHIRVEGNFPVIWKEKIKELFESGVYLID